MNLPYKRIAIATTAFLSFSLAASAAVPISRTLSYGSKGNDVKALQIFLNTHSHIVARSGDGSPGHETIYFKSGTQTALKAFQNQYSAELVTGVGLKKPSGVLGPVTQVKMGTILGGVPFTSLVSANDMPVQITPPLVVIPPTNPVTRTNIAYPAPVITSNTPSVLPANNQLVNFSINTDIGANCKWDTDPTKDWASMSSGFQTTGGTTHTYQVAGVANGSTYTYYVRCQSTDSDPNGVYAISENTPITFSIAAVTQFTNNLNVYVYNQAGTVTSDDAHINCGATGTICAASYASPTSVTLMANTDSNGFNFVFDHWDASANSGCYNSISNTCTMSVTGNVWATPQFIIANAGSDQTTSSGSAVSFSAAGSKIPTTGTVNYSWDFGDGQKGTGITTTHTYQSAQAKTFTATLTIKDPVTNKSSTDSKSVTVNALSQTTVDYDVPNLVITTPSQEIITVQTNQITISGTAVDASGVGSVTLSNWATPFTPNPDEVTADTSDGFANWSKTIPLHSGQNIIQVTASDNSPSQNYTRIALLITAPGTQ